MVWSKVIGFWESFNKNLTDLQIRFKQGPKTKIQYSLQFIHNLSHPLWSCIIIYSHISNNISEIII